ncbi:MAG: hypothetical protein BIFFINMI_03695 [Phycisphaerae bacterium]|nr:hypothetical protein [Phycisphaerae bacterium]
MSGRKLMFIALFLALAAPAMAADLATLDVPLTLQDVAGVERTAEPCSTGVPMPYGLLHNAEVAKLAVFAPDGKAVPVQFKVLENWREFGQDATCVKWLEVTFLADVPAGKSATYHLKVGDNPAPATPARPAERLSPFTLRFTDPDGKVSTDADVKDVQREVVETGPVRAVVKFESPGSRDPFGFIACVTTYAGSPRTDLSVVLKNSPRASQGPLYFKDFAVAVKASGSPFLLGGAPGQTVTTDKPAYLYQASDGTKGWDAYGGDWRDEIVLDWGKKFRESGKPDFKGYRVMEGDKQLAEGDAALGWAASESKDGGQVLATRWFYQNYPSAVEVGNGQLVAHLWPKQMQAYGGLHWLDDMQRKRYDVTLQTLGHTMDAADGDAIAMAFDRPLVAHCGYEWYETAGLLGSARGQKPADAKALAVGEFPRSFTPGIGWVTFGADTSDRIKRRYHNGSMSRFIATANPWDAYALMASMDHACGMNCMSVDDYQYPRDAGMLNYGQYCSPLRPTGKYLPGTAHHGYMPWNVAHLIPTEVFHGWRLFGDPLAGRMVNELAVFLEGYVDWREKRPGQLVAGTRADGHPLYYLTECYRVLGQDVQMDCLRRMAEVSWKQVNKDRGNYGVMGSWEGGNDRCEKPFMMCQVLDGLESYWRLTHDERTADQCVGMIDFIVSESSMGQWGFTYVVKLDPGAQAGYLASSLAAAEKDGKHVSYAHLARTIAFAYYYTGDRKFRDAIDCLNVKAYPYQSGAYTNFYPEREDQTPPAAVADLKAEALGGGKVKLTWTTPPDTARLQVKFTAQSMVERCTPEQYATNDNWWAATHVPNEPSAEGGKAQSMVVEGVEAGAKVFAIRSFDAAGNRSPIGNQVQIDVK